MPWLAAVAVFGLVLGVVGLVAPKTFAKPGDSVDSATRHLLVTRAKDFASTYNTYDSADLDDYQKRMKALLTTDYNKQFTEVTDALFPTLQKVAQSSGDPKILAVGIKSVGSNTAEVLVAVDATVTSVDDKGKSASALRHFRWDITFHQVKGDWRVAEFQSVAALDASLASPSPSASSTASPSPSSGGDK